jgi:ABC-type multidrug transport system fused ATPase/permease subunit
MEKKFIVYGVALFVVLAAISGINAWKRSVSLRGEPQEAERLAADYRERYEQSVEDNQRLRDDNQRLGALIGRAREDVSRIRETASRNAGNIREAIELVATISVQVEALNGVLSGSGPADGGTDRDTGVED